MLFDKDEPLEPSPRRTKTLLISAALHLVLVVVIALVVFGMLMLFSAKGFSSLRKILELIETRAAR